MTVSSLRASAVLIALLIVQACSNESAAPILRDAWIRAVPPERAMTAAYVVIDNPTDRELIIEGVAATGFGRVEIHESIEDDGVSRMRPVNAIRVAPDNTVTLQPGGLHIMLMESDAAIEAGRTVELQFMSSTHGTLAISAPVKGAATAVH